MVRGDRRRVISHAAIGKPTPMTTTKANANANANPLLPGKA
jgi:hypothetical protein